MAELFDEITFNRMDLEGTPVDGIHGLGAERMRELRRRPKKPRCKGLTLRDLAERSAIPRRTLEALLEAHGYLETAPFGRDQSRRLLTDRSIAAGIGANVHHRAQKGADTAFPVFFPDTVDAVLWTLDYEGLKDKATTFASRRNCLEWLLDEWDSLPNAELASLSGYSVKAVEKTKRRGKVGLPVIIRRKGSAWRHKTQSLVTAEEERL